jgi:putative two-component system response regulator
MTSLLTEKLQAIVRAGGSAPNSALKTVLTGLVAEIRERSKGSHLSVDYFVAAFRALSGIKGTAHAEARMQCLRDCQLFFYSNGLTDEALAAAELLKSLAESVNDKKWLRIADTVSGIIHGDMGDVAEAVVHYSRALDWAIECGDNRGEISVLVNLGSALNYAGLYREAIPCLKRAIEICVERDESAPTFLPSGWCNIAQSYLNLGEISAGFDAITQALAVSPEPVTALDNFNRTVREFTFVQIALEFDRIREAKAHALQCRNFALRCGSPRAKFLADIAEGLCEIQVGDVQKGLRLIEGTLGSTVTELGTFRAEALKALVKAYDQVNRPDAALECLHQLLVYIRSLREKSATALLAKSNQIIDRPIPELTDLHVLTHKEAELKVKVAVLAVAETQVEMLERLAIAADLKEESSGEHGYRVGALASQLARELGWNKDACFDIEIAARLHDIGKIAMPDRILFSLETLKEAERQYISTHTLIGAELLTKGSFPQLQTAQEIARYHHEWWNGEGYPTGIAGEKIPVHARIVALADVFDALTHGRPYAPAWSTERALSEIESRRGTQFDPKLSVLFIELVRRLVAQHEDLDVFLGRAGQASPFLRARQKIKSLLTAEQRREAHAGGS